MRVTRIPLPPAVPARRSAGGFALLRAAAVLLPAIAVAGAGILSWRDVAREATLRLDRTVEMLHHHALGVFATQDAILVATARAASGLGGEQLRDSLPLHRLLADLAAVGGPVVGGALVADGAGRIVSASWEFPARPVDLSDRDYMRALLQGGAERAVGVPIDSRPMGWRLFPIARRAGGEGPGEAAAIVSSFSPEPFASFYASVVESPGDVVVLVRTDGAVLARHPPLAEAPGEAPRAGWAALLDRLPDGAAPVPRPAVPSPIDGEMRIFAARRLGEWPVAVAYGLGTGALASAWRLRMVAPVAGGVTAAALLLALTGLAQAGARARQAEAEARAEAEAQLARAGRAAALGLLAAGLAHDVKNLVQTVRSGARVMERRADDPAEIRRCAALVGDAAERGGRLVDSMLGFARGRAEAPAAPLDLHVALRDLSDLLSRTLGGGWTLRAELPDGLPPALGDRAGFEAAVVNLAANARDAMPAGGVITISARAEALAEAAAPEGPAAGLRAGRYLVTAVADRGPGMDAATLARLGEPFFTTKPAGRGTGLGLATVRGFCVRAGGALRIESAPGRGTTAEIWLPAA